MPRFYDRTQYADKPKLPWAPMKLCAGGRWENYQLLAEDAAEARDMGGVLLLDVKAGITARSKRLGHKPAQVELESTRSLVAWEAHGIDPGIRVGNYWPGNEMTHQILVGNDNLIAPLYGVPGVTITNDFLLGEHYISSPASTINGWLKHEVPKMRECRYHWRCEHVVGINLEYYKGIWSGKHNPLPYELLEQMVEAALDLRVDAIAFFTFWYGDDSVDWSSDLPVAKILDKFAY